MTDYERKSGAINSSTNWPYHSETRDDILAQMHLHGGPAPLPPHLQNAHALVSERTFESLDDDLELSEQELAILQDSVRLLQSHINDLRLAKELHTAAEELPV